MIESHMHIKMTDIQMDRKKDYPLCFTLNVLVVVSSSDSFGCKKWNGIINFVRHKIG